MVQGEPIPEDDTEDNVSAPEPEADAEGTDTGNEPESPEALPEPQSGESSSQGTDSAQKEQPEAQSQSTSGTSTEWVDSTPNLEGDIKELKDGQLTVVEAITEKSDNGGDIIVSPSSSGDSARPEPPVVPGYLMLPPSFHRHIPQGSGCTAPLSIRSFFLLSFSCCSPLI